jgi:hypothetical protein
MLLAGRTPFCHGSTAALNLFIQLIAEAKGLPPRVGNAEAEAFFRRTAEERLPGDSPHPPDSSGSGYFANSANNAMGPSTRCTASGTRQVE